MAGKPNVFDAAKEAVTALEKLDDEDRARGLRFVADALGLVAPGSAGNSSPADGPPNYGGLGDGGQTPKEFMATKEPQSKLEEIACLAYYLKRHRNKPHFRPADLTELNTEAQGNVFDQISRDVDNAKRHGGLVTNGAAGTHQLTRLGEQVVEALPNRDAVKAVRDKGRRPAKRTTKKTVKKT